MPIFSLFHLDSLVNPWHASLLRKFKMTVKRGILFITPNLEWRIQDPMTFWMCPKLSRHQWQNWDPNPSRADTTLDLPKLAAWTGLKGASHLLLFTSPEPFQNVLCHTWCQVGEWEIEQYTHACQKPACQRVHPPGVRVDFCVSVLTEPGLRIYASAGKANT